MTSDDQDDPLLALKRLKAQSSAPASESDPLEQLKALKPPVHDYHAEYKSGALAKREQGAIKREQESAAEGDAATNAGAGSGIATHLLNAATGIPGVEAVEAGAGALGSQVTDHPMSYRESRQTLKDQLKTINHKVAGAERFAGSLLTLPVLRGSPARAGAMLGAADQVLNSDPDVGPGGRAVRGTIGAGLGAASGKLLEMLPTAVRALRTPLSESQISAQSAARDASAKQLYAKAIAEGQGRTNTPAIQAELSKPDNANLLAAAGELRQNAGFAPHAPEMLDKLYKGHSTIAANLQRGVESATPSRNLGTESLKNEHLAQQDLLDAMSGGTSLPGPMPSYRTAVQDYAKRSGNIEATQEGQDVLRHSLRKSITPGKALDKTTPTAFADWRKTVSPEEAAHAAKGILGATREDLGQHPLKSITGALPFVKDRGLQKAPSLLRLAGDEQQRTVDMLIKAGLLAGNSTLP